MHKVVKHGIALPDSWDDYSSLEETRDDVVLSSFSRVEDLVEVIKKRTVTAEIAVVNYDSLVAEGSELEVVLRKTLHIHQVE
jgi:hypothetical protein